MSRYKKSEECLLRLRYSDCSLIIHELTISSFLQYVLYSLIFYECRSAEASKTKLNSSFQVLLARDGLLVRYGTFPKLWRQFSAYAMTFLHGSVHVLIVGNLGRGQKKSFLQES